MPGLRLALSPFVEIAWSAHLETACSHARCSRGEPSYTPAPSIPVSTRWAKRACGRGSSKRPTPVHRIFEAAGELLAVTEDGVIRAREGTPILRPASAILTDRNISALSVDPLGQLWVGYFDRGLDVVDAGITRVPAHGGRTSLLYQPHPA